MDEIATTCDSCNEGIPYGITCHAIPDGTWGGDDADNGKPVVKIYCHRCYLKTGRTSHPVGVRAITQAELDSLIGATDLDQARNPQ